jgi:hypothetical protein
VFGAIILAILGACSSTSRVRQTAEDSPGTAKPEQEAGGTFSLVFENDFFAGQDNNYTSGAALQWTTDPIGSYPDDSFYPRVVDGLSFLPFIGDDDRKEYLSFSLTQQIYTATDLEDPNPPEDDQPYAGLLYINSNLISRAEYSQHEYGILLGVIGPAAGAEQVQKFAHEVVRTDEPGAWHQQLKNEPLVNLNYAFHYRLLHGNGDDGGFDWDLTSSLAGNFGSYMTGGGLGLIGRIGFRMPNSYSSFGIQSGFTPNPIASDYPSDDWGGFIFVGINGMGISHFAPHGNLWESGRSVDTEPFVGAGSVGLRIYHSRYTFSYSFTRQTDMFETQRRSSKYGTVVLSCSF